MRDDRETLWLDETQTRFFLVPDDTELAAGGFAIRNLVNLRKSVDPAALLPFEISREQADQRIRGQVAQFADAIKGALAGLFTRPQEPLPAKDTTTPSPAPPFAGNAAERIRHGASLVEQGIEQFFSGVKQAMSEALARPPESPAPPGTPGGEDGAGPGRGEARSSGIETTVDGGRADRSD